MICIRLKSSREELDELRGHIRGGGQGRRYGEALRHDQDRPRDRRISGMVTRAPALTMICGKCRGKTDVPIAQLEDGTPRKCRHCGYVIKPTAEFTMAMRGT